MADLLKPDAVLATLEQKLEKAKTQKEQDAIQQQIDTRRSEIMKQTGFTNLGFGSGGSFIPGAGQGVGSEILEPTGIPGIFAKSSIGTDTSVDPYGRTSVGNTGNLKTFYDENGKQLTPAQIAATPLGAAYASKGWDIGFGTGNVGAGTPATKNLPFSGSANTTNLPFSGSASTINLKTPAQIAAETASATAKGERQSAYDLLYQQFNQYGLGALVTPLKDLVISGASPSEFTIKLRETEAYKKRFAANSQRIAKGLTAISEAEYLGLEDQYQNIMRNYGLPAEYYTRGDMGTQEGFNKFIANDVSATELEDRVLTAQSRVMNANPEVLASLKSFYPDITNGDILAYTLDPTKALTDIKRKVTAAEIGGAATQAGLGITGTRAGELTAAGITKAQAQQGFQTVAEVAPRGGQLAEIYKQSPYTQTTAEAEVFGLAGSAEAARQRKKLTSLETAAFSGSAGAGAIARDRAGVL